MAKRFLSYRRFLAVVVTLMVLLPVVAATAQSRFVDVEDTNVFVDDIEWLADSGVTRGCNPPANDMFCPDKAVTRGQMAAFMHRLSGLFDADDNGAVDEAETLDGLVASQLIHAYAKYDEMPIIGFDSGSWTKIVDIEFDPPTRGLVHVSGTVDYSTSDTEFGHDLEIRVCTNTCSHTGKGIDLAQWGVEDPNSAQVLSVAVLPVETDDTAIEMWARAPGSGAVDIVGRRLTAMFTPFGFAIDCDGEGECYTHKGQ
jgi:hypothetical protein